VRKELNQHLFSPLSWLLVLLVVILLVLVLLLLTPLGPRTAAQIASSSIDELSIEGVSGSLLGGIHVDKFSWQDGIEDKTGIVLDNIDLKLQKYDFDNGKVFANIIQADHLSVNLGNTTKHSRDDVVIPDFGLPLNIDAKVVTLKSLRITKRSANNKSKKNNENDLETLFEIGDLQLENLLIKDHKLHFARLQGNPVILDAPLKINVTDGYLNMDQPHDLHTSGTVSFKHEELGQAAGDIKLNGTLTHYEFVSDLDVRQIQLGNQKLKLTGKGDYKQVSFDSVRLTGSDGTLKGKADVKWNPTIKWSFKGEGKSLKTARWLPDWPANANAVFEYKGSFQNDKTGKKVLKNDVSLLSLKGKLKNYAVKAKGKISTSGDQINTKGLELQLGDNKIKVSGQASEPYDLSFDVNANNLKQVIPPSAGLKLAGQIKGKGSIKGTLDKPEITLNVRADNLVYDDFKQGKNTLFVNGKIKSTTLTGTAGAEKNHISTDGLEIKLGDNKIRVAGIVSEPVDLKIDIDTGNLKQIALVNKSSKANDMKLAGRVKGTVSVKGFFKKPEIKLNIRADKLAYQDYKQGKEALFVEGELALQNNKDLTLKNVIAKTGKNRIQVSGVASEPMNIEWSVDAKKLSQVSPDLGGSIKGEGSLKGSYKSPLIKADIKAHSLRFKDQKIGKTSIQAKGEVQITDGVPVIKSMNLYSASNRIQISGKASSPFDLKWDIDSKNLKQFLPELSGRLKAKGKLKGTIDKPLINATINANNLRYQDMRLGSGNFVAKTQKGQYNITGNVKNLEVSGQKIISAKLDASGKIENHAVKLSFKHNTADVQLKARGGWKKQQWNGTLQQLQYNDKKAGKWVLSKPVQISASKNKVSTSRFCLSGALSKQQGGAKTQMCSKASWGKKSGIAAEGQLHKTPLALLKPWLPKGIELNGHAEGTYNIKQHNGHPKGTLKIKLPDSSFIVKSENGETQTFSYEKASINATINDKVITSKVTMTVVNRGKFSSTSVIKLSPQNGKHTINGSAQFDVPNINWAQQYIPHSRGLRGAFSSKVTFTGLLNKPKVVGRAALKNGYLRLPEAGTELTNINLNMVADRPGMAKINGKMLMGKGVLNITGDVDARNIAKFKAVVKISGKNIRFMNTNEIKATMSPNLTMVLTPKVMAFKGKVVIPEATINLKEIPELSIDESEDAIVIGEQKKGERVSAIKVHPNVIVELGKKVKLNAFGLRARLEGNVNITHNRRDVLAQGSLKVLDGKYQAYGQNLEINNGRLIFNGSPKLVGMNIRATRKVDDSLVGVHLGGTILKPKSKIFSDPSMPDSEALSLLLTGHTLDSLSGAKSAVLMSAVRGLGISGSGSLLTKIGSSIGLDDVNIVTKEDFRKSELALHKRLGSGLYVRYIVGLFDQAQKIAIDYKINKFLSLQAETSVDNYGLDFIYKIERD